MNNNVECSQTSIQRFDEYIKKSQERLITVASNSDGNIRRNKKQEKLLNFKSYKLANIANEKSETC